MRGPAAVRGGVSSSSSESLVEASLLASLGEAGVGGRAVAAVTLVLCLRLGLLVGVGSWIVGAAAAVEEEEPGWAAMGWSSCSSMGGLAVVG